MALPVSPSLDEAVAAEVCAGCRACVGGLKDRT